MKPISLKIKTNNKSYNILIGSDLISNISKIFKNNSITFKKCLLLIDKNISNKNFKLLFSHLPSRKKKKSSIKWK